MKMAMYTSDTHEEIVTLAIPGNLDFPSVLVLQEPLRDYQEHTFLLHRIGR